jgi:hypothetical protein
MSASAETQVAQRQILLVGPYGVLGTGVVDAVAENRQWGITTAARRPVPTYRAQTAPPHVSVDLMVPGYEHTLIWVNPAIRTLARSKGLTAIPTRSFRDLAAEVFTS